MALKILTLNTNMTLLDLLDLLNFLEVNLKEAEMLKLSKVVSTTLV